MTSEDGNDGRFPDGIPVLVPFPVTKAEADGDRASWPWLPATIQSQCGPDEWSVVIGHPAAATLDGEPCYPVVFRDASEIRLPDPGVAGLAEQFFSEYPR